MVTLQLSGEQADGLRDLIDAWLDGFEEATKEVVGDRSIDTPEELCLLVSGMHEQFDLFSTIRSMLPLVVSGSG